MKQVVIFGSVIILAALGGFFLYRHQLVPQPPPVAISSEPSSTLPERLPEFSLVNRAGEKQSISSWPGKSLVINFWATWCGPCRKEIPFLQQIAKSRRDQGFEVIGIAVDFRDDVLKYADQMHIEYPLLIGEEDGLAAVNAFGIEAVGFPFTIFTDSQGRIVTSHMGELRANEAKVILDAVHDVNQNRMTLPQAKSQIARSLATLMTKEG